MKLGKFNEASDLITQAIMNTSGGGMDIVIFGGGFRALGACIQSMIFCQMRFLRKPYVGGINRNFLRVGTLTSSRRRATSKENLSRAFS